MKLYGVDAFTEKPFRGNPAAVCLLDQPRDDLWLQSLAMEMNWSETAFVTKKADHFGLRWFTPTHEVPLCGHATLAAAFVLFHLELVSPTAEISFATASGRLTARRSRSGITLNFPVDRPRDAAAIPERVLTALRVHPVRHRVTAENYLLELAAESHIRAAKPDLPALAEATPRGVIITAPGDEPEVDFVSRFFAPGIGIPEDPVTGSAHCSLAPYWAERIGGTQFRAYQASARGGYLDVALVSDRVYISGQAVLTFCAELLV